MIKQIVFLAILTTVIVAAWLVLGIVHDFQTSTLSPTTQTQIIQIPDTFDTNVIAQLKKRNVVSVDLQQALPATAVSPTPSPSLPALSLPINTLAQQSLATNSVQLNSPQIVSPTPTPTIAVSSR